MKKIKNKKGKNNYTRNIKKHIKNTNDILKSKKNKSNSFISINKKSIFLIVIIIIITILFSLYLFINHDPCNKIEDSKKDDCYFENSKNNLEKCFKINDMINREYCILEYSLNHLDYMSCENLSFDSRDYCIREISSLKLSEMHCDEIIDIETKNECYLSVIKQIDDVLICDKIVDNYELIQECYYLHAINFVDSNSCNKIIDTELKDKCHIKMAISKFANGIC
ncbi:MAG: hypothetical protein ACMXYG_05545 [Candidatus Woesearchaeota archaeon]